MCEQRLICRSPQNVLVYGKMHSWERFLPYTMDALWTGPQVADIVGINYDTLDYWVKRCKLVTPSIPASKLGRRNHYSSANIFALAAIKALRDQGISLQKLRKAETELWQRIGMNLEQGLRGGVVVADGQDVFAVLFTLDDAIQIMSLLKGGQLLLPLDNLVEEVEQRIAELLEREEPSIPRAMAMALEVQRER